MDYTPDVIARVLVANSWGATAGHDAAKAIVIGKFFDWLMIENAASAAKKKPPADYRRAKEIWARALESAGPSQEHASFQQRAGGSQGGHGQPKKQFQPQRPGIVRAQPQVGGLYVCYAFNDLAGCQRPKQGQGCRLTNGQVFIHACTARKANGEWCLANHSRQQHK